MLVTTNREKLGNWVVHIRRKLHQQPINLPPKTSHRSVNEAPSANGPTTDVNCDPDSSIMMIFWGGTATRSKKYFIQHDLQRWEAWVQIRCNICKCKNLITHLFFYCLIYRLRVVRAWAGENVLATRECYNEVKRVCAWMRAEARFATSRVVVMKKELLSNGVFAAHMLPRLGRFRRHTAGHRPLNASAINRRINKKKCMITRGVKRCCQLGRGIKVSICRKLL